MQAHPIIRPMGAGEIIRKGFWVWRAAPVRLSLINLPGILVRFLLFIILIITIVTNQTVIDQILRERSGFLLSVILISLFSFFLIAGLFLVTLLNYFPVLAMVFAASNVVLRRPVSIWKSFRRAFSISVFSKYTVFITQIMLALFLFTILALLVSKSLIPGFIIESADEPLENWWTVILIYFIWITVMDLASFLLLPVLALEKSGIKQTSQRIREFLKEYGRHMLWTYFIAYWLPFSVTAAPILIPLAGIGGSTDVTTLDLMLCCLSFFYIFFGLSFSSIATIVMILSYYDIRSRKEKYNEEILAEEMGYLPLVEIITP